MHNDEKNKVVLEVHSITSPSSVITLGGWYEYTFSSSFFEFANSFTVGTIPLFDYRKFFKTGGHKVKLYVDSVLRMQGIIDAVAKHLTGDEYTYTLTGRNFGGLLVDAEPLMVTYHNKSVSDLAKILIEPYSDYIKEVVTDNASNRFIIAGKKKGTGVSSPLYRGTDTEKRYTTRTKVTDKIADVLKSVCEMCGVHVWVSADGKLILTRPQYDQKSVYSGSLYINCDSEGHIIKSNCTAEWTPTIQNRHSVYKVIGQGEPSATAIGEEIIGKAGEVKDPSPAFWSRNGETLSNRLHKPHTIQFKSVRDGKMARRLARSKMEQEAVKGFGLNVTVDGLRLTNDDPMWSEDTMIAVDFQPFDLKGMFMISSVNQRNDGMGASTQLGLIPPNVWLAQNNDDSLSDDQYETESMKRIYW